MRKSQHLSVKCARAVTPKVVDVWIAYVKKLFQESGQCGHVSKDFSNKLWNCICNQCMKEASHQMPNLHQKQ